MGKFHPDDRVIYESLSKRAALVGIFHGFVVANSGEARGLNSDSESLVVKICHNDFKSLVFFADKVLHWYFDIFECDVGCSRGPHTLAVHLTCGDSRHSPLNEENRHTTHPGLARADGNSEVVRPDTVGDPFLCGRSWFSRDREKGYKEIYVLSPLTI